MTRSMWVSLLASAVMYISACDISGAFGPVDTEEVTITLAVSGGIAGVSYAFRVDGRAATVVGVSCTSFCDFETGEVILPVSAAQVEHLARMLEEAEVLGLDGRDFGVDCCDDFVYDLTYMNGQSSAHVVGAGARLPQELAGAVAQLHGLVYGFLPALVSPATDPADWPRHTYTLGQTIVDGLTLTAELTYGGGCRDHRVDLVLWGQWLESSPPHINALLTHDDGDDPCDALITTERHFNLVPLRDAYERAFGEIGPTRPKVVLRLWDPVAASPLGRLIEVTL